MKRVAVFVSGSGSNLQALIEAAAAPDYPATVALVVSNKAGVYALERAKGANIPALVVNHKAYESREAFEAVLLDTLAAHEIDIICLAGFMRVLTASFVEKWEGRILNIHPSLLPKYKGLHVHQRALDAGDKESGCTVHFVTAGLDDGPVVGQSAVPIHEGDSAETLAERILVQEHLLYPACLKKVALEL